MTITKEWDHKRMIMEIEDLEEELSLTETVKVRYIIILTLKNACNICNYTYSNAFMVN